MEKATHEQQMQLLTQRIAHLERSQRYWRMLGALALLTLAGLGLLGAAERKDIEAAQEIRARAFVLVDQQGGVLARLGPLPQGGPGLGVYDQGGKNRLLLMAEPHGPTGLRLFGRDGQGSIMLGVGANGAPSLRLLDQNWRVRASLAAWPDGSPYLELVDKDGQARTILGYTELMVMPAGTIERRPASSLVFLSDQGDVLLRLP
jgi:hypothetical protein